MAEIARIRFRIPRLRIRIALSCIWVLAHIPLPLTRAQREMMAMALADWANRGLKVVYAK